MGFSVLQEVPECLAEKEYMGNGEKMELDMKTEMVVGKKVRSIH